MPNPAIFYLKPLSEDLLAGRLAPRHSRWKGLLDVYFWVVAAIDLIWLAIVVWLFWHQWFGGDGEKKAQVIFVASILIPMNGFFVASYWLLRVRTGLEMRLLEHGQRLEGTVTACKSSGAAGSGPYKVELSYRFHAPEGYDLTGQTTVRRDDLRGQPLPAPGTPVLVLYVDGHNYDVL